MLFFLNRVDPRDLSQLRKDAGLRPQQSAVGADNLSINPRFKIFSTEAMPAYLDGQSDSCSVAASPVFDDHFLGRN